MDEAANIEMSNIKNFEELNHFIASNTMSTLGNVFTQYSKLFLNSKKLTVSESCAASDTYSKSYCSSLEIIGKIITMTILI